MANKPTVLIVASVATAFCIASHAHGEPSTAETLSEILPNLSETNPDAHRYLSDGTFDAMSPREQLHFMVELQKERDRYRLDALDDEPTPESRDRMMELMRESILRSMEAGKIDSLLGPSVEVASDWTYHWYLYSRKNCIGHIFSFPTQSTSDPCPACLGHGPNGPVVSVMAVSLESPTTGLCYECAKHCPTGPVAESLADQIPDVLLQRMAGADD